MSSPGNELPWSLMDVGATDSARHARFGHKLHQRRAGLAVAAAQIVLFGIDEAHVVGSLHQPTIVVRDL